MKTLLALLIFVLFVATNAAFATEKEKPKPAPTVVSQSSDTDRHSANLYGSAVVAGLATTALRDKPNGALWAFVGTTAAAAAIEAGHSGSFNSSNVWHAVAGAAVGTVGVCKVYFAKGFVGCGMPF